MSGQSAAPGSGAGGGKSDVKTQSTQARDSRMTLRKNNEEVLRKALQNEARQKCAEETRAFGECAKDAGIWVVLSCRKHNLAMSDCMAQHYSEEIFAKFLADRGLPPVQQRATITERLASTVFGGGGGK